MDFGNILDEWDKRVEKNAGAWSPVFNPAAIGSARAVGRPDGAWLRMNGVYDKDAQYEDSPRRAGERRRRLRRKKPDAVIDLHGLTQEEAWAGLENFFRIGKQQGLEKVLIVHGKGSHPGSEGVLREMVRKFIESCPMAGESGPAHAAEGGSGATWVILK